MSPSLSLAHQAELVNRKQFVTSNVFTENHTKPQVKADSLPLLIFKIADQLYGLPIFNVIRIIEMVTLTQLPGVSDMIQGIINLHGKTVPVIDLRRRFGLPPQAYGLHTPIILAEMGVDHRLLGLIVDDVEDVLDVPPEAFELTGSIVPTELMNQMTNDASYLAGVAKIDRQIILILNIQTLMTPTDQFRLSQALGD